MKKSLPEIIEEYLQCHAAVWSDHTRMRAKTSLNQMMTWIGEYKTRASSKFDIAMASKFCSDINKKFPKSAYKTVHCVKQFFKWAHESAGYFESNPMKAVRSPHMPDQVPRENFTEEEYRRLLSFADGFPDQRLLVMLGWSTGMSIKDCASLKWGEVDLETCTINRKRSKTGVLSTIPFEPHGDLHRELCERRSMYDKVDPYQSVMPNMCVKKRDGVPTNEPADAFRRLKIKAGIPKHKTFHNFRATLISDLVDKNVAIATAMRVTGHKTPESFMKYATVSVNTIRKALAGIRISGGKINAGEVVDA